MPLATAATPFERDILLPPGRAVRVLEVGDPDGRPVIALHGTPGSRLKFRSAHAPALAAGIRLIAPDRWGYAATAIPANATLSGYADDVAAIADNLAIGDFGLIGISGGGPFAVAAASRLRHRMTRVALVSPVGPVADANDADISLFHKLCFLGIARTPGAARLVFAAFRVLVLADPQAGVRIAASRASPADRAIIMDPRHCHGLAETFAEGLAASSRGPALDMRLFGQPWSAAAMPPGTARIWLGSDDRNVPSGPVRALARQMHAELVGLPGAGHYWFTGHMHQVFEWLSAPNHST